MYDRGSAWVRRFCGWLPAPAAGVGPAGPEGPQGPAGAGVPPCIIEASPFVVNGSRGLLQTALFTPFIAPLTFLPLKLGTFIANAGSNDVLTLGLYHDNGDGTASLAYQMSADVVAAGFFEMSMQIAGGSVYGGEKWWAAAMLQNGSAQLAVASVGLTPTPSALERYVGGSALPGDLSGSYASSARPYIYIRTA